MRYLANSFNSTIIEMYTDMFWISLIIQSLKRLKYIAVTYNSTLKIESYDIINFGGS